MVVVAESGISSRDSVVQTQPVFDRVLWCFVEVGLQKDDLQASIGARSGDSEQHLSRCVGSVVGPWTGREGR